jgi:hypothetical protein
MTTLLFTMVLQGVDFASFDQAAQSAFLTSFKSVYYDILGPSGSVTLLNVYPGSVIVQLSLFSIASLPSDGSGSFCIVLSRTKSTLVSALQATNPSAYANVNVAVQAATTCKSCVCNAETSSVDGSSNKGVIAAIVVPVVVCGLLIVIILMVYLARQRRKVIVTQRFGSFF